MKINNKKVQGLYIYNTSSSNIEFTKGDFVVSGDSIYVCDAESVSGIDPAKDIYFEYYHPYPGSRIITASEYFQYVESDNEGELPDKYISIQALKGILQGYQFGINMRGEIEDWIDENGDTSLSLSSVSDRRLDDLILTESLNRGTVKVSYKLSQIADGIVDDDKNFSTLFGFLDRKDNTGEVIDYQLILSQYTYKQNDRLYIRVQELTSPLAGVSVYRYMYWNVDNFPTNGNVISSWINVFTYSSTIKDKLDDLSEYYNKLGSQLEAKINSICGSFRFKEVYTGTGSETFVPGLDPGIYTVCLEGRGMNETKTYSESVTVSLKSEMPEYDIYFDKLSGHIHITSSSIALMDPHETKIISVYGRDIKTQTNNE